MTEPTDKELEALIDANLLVVEGGQCAFESWVDIRPELVKFARAVLTKWGTPAPVGVEPALHQYQARDGTWKDFDSERHRRDTVAAGYPVRTLYTVTQPQARAVTDAQVLAAVRVVSPNLFRHGLQPLPHDGANTAAQMRKEADTVRKMLEAAHGIKQGGQHV